MTILTIHDNGTKREINYSELSADYIEKSIQGYEEKHGMSYTDFYSRFDCGEADMDELTDLLDWESLVEEQKVRAEKAVYQKS
ncbi:hypothetical protein ACFL6S_18485 [Candidatus Poribacteria bacterium]